MFIDGVFYVLINVLQVLMGITGPTPVVGFSGTTTSAIHFTAGASSNHAVSLERK